MNNLILFTGWILLSAAVMAGVFVAGVLIVIGLA
jgi:hypothetical protein